MNLRLREIPLLATLAMLALPAIAGEAIQHLVEVEFGMYVRGDGIASGHEANLRLCAAGFKVFGFLVTIKWVRKLVKKASGGINLSALLKCVFIATPLVAHYVLNYSAVGKANWMVTLLVVIDCVNIGFLAIAIGLALPKRTSVRSAAPANFS